MWKRAALQKDQYLGCRWSSLLRSLGIVQPVMRFVPTVAWVAPTMIGSFVNTAYNGSILHGTLRSDSVFRNLNSNGRIRQIRRFSSNSVESFSEESDLYLVAASEDMENNSNTVSTLASQFATTYHAPVMWKECVSALNSCARGRQRTTTEPGETKNNPLIFVDGTLGGGGHAAAVLETLQPGDILFGADVDPDALAVASQRLSAYIPSSASEPVDRPWFIPVASNFAELSTQRLCDTLLATCDDLEGPTVAMQLKNHGVDGLLLDLGVSSHQIDTADRGFAFMKAGPLDMRMDKDGGKRLTAADLCNELDALELRRILQTYGDEPRASAIADSIVQRRPFSTTNDLFEAVAAVTPAFARKGRRMGRMATMARVFQSLRIVVNQEDTVLERALTHMAPSLLRSGGRLVVLAYHSMEDRATKRVMRDGTTSKREAEWNNGQRDMYGNHIGEPKPFRTVGKAQKATNEEVELNVRARSATLRVAERQ